jgi:hypothetical protein
MPPNNPRTGRAPQDIGDRGDEGKMSRDRLLQILSGIKKVVWRARPCSPSRKIQSCHFLSGIGAGSSHPPGRRSTNAAIGPLKRSIFGGRTGGPFARQRRAPDPRGGRKDLA